MCQSRANGAVGCSGLLLQPLPARAPNDRLGAWRAAYPPPVLEAFCGSGEARGRLPSGLRAAGGRFGGGSRTAPNGSFSRSFDGYARA